MCKSAPTPFFLLLVVCNFLKMNQDGIEGEGAEGAGEAGQCTPASGKDSRWLGRGGISQIHWSFLASPPLDVIPAPSPLMQKEHSDVRAFVGRLGRRNRDFRRRAQGLSVTLALLGQPAVFHKRFIDQQRTCCFIYSLLKSG